MAAFEEYSSIPYMNPLIIDLRFKTLVSAFDEEGEEKRRRKWLFVKRDVTLSYKYLSRTDARTLWQFYIDRYGSYEAFNFFLNYLDTYEGEYVGTGDGVETIFNLPSKNGSTYSIYVDGVLQTGGGVDYDFGTGTGADGADKVTFVAAPSDGEYITYDFVGILKVRCRFAEDNLSLEQIHNRFVSIGIILRGLLNE